MKNYVLIFRLNITDSYAQPSKEQMKQFMEHWMQWVEEIAKDGKLANGGNHLAYQGIVLRPGGKAANLPYAADKESVAGYIIINAHDMEDAVAIAGKCPILSGGPENSVEIRETATPQSMNEMERS